VEWLLWAAAAGGHPEVLQWAREHGCRCYVWTCHNAAARGHLAVLKWARHHDCPWVPINVCTRRRGWAAGGVEVGAGARLPVGCDDVVHSQLVAGTWTCCGGRGQTAASGMMRRINLG